MQKERCSMQNQSLRAMGDFDMSKDHHRAGTILFGMASIGLACNVSVVTFLRSMPSLNNSFGKLTFSQAIVDSIHQLMYTFYVAPAIFSQNSAMYSISDHVGYICLTAYQICCYSHLCISVNRFVAVCVPLTYTRLFSEERTRFLIFACWVIGFCHMTIIMQIKDCALYLPENSWIWSMKAAPSCDFIMWHFDFLVNSALVITVAVLDISSITRLHCMKVLHTDTNSVQRRKALMNLTYQAALQGICFITELITYFILSHYSRNKWELFALTSVAWCLVTGIDGLTVLLCNRDFRRKIIILLEPEQMPQYGTTTIMSSNAPQTQNATAVAPGTVRQF